jgi:hypothetical protein
MRQVLSAASVTNMGNSTGAAGPGATGNAVPGEFERGWRLLAVTSAVLAAVGVLSLATVLLLKVAGLSPWTGLNWIAMIGLPLAFLGMAAGLLHAIRRRRLL